jgi:heavy metal sensor kinase
MKSIRLSLLIYFALLVALALGAVSALAYHTARQSLRDRQRSLEALLRSKYQERSHQQMQRLDESLLAEARSLGGLVQMQVQNPRHGRLQLLSSVGLLTCGNCPSGFCTVPLWLAEGTKSKVGNYIFTLGQTPRLIDMVLPGQTEGQATQYFQINMRNGAKWRSPSMGPYSFPFNAWLLGKKKGLLDWQFDDTELRPDQRVRRVTLRVAGFRVLMEGHVPGSRGLEEQRAALRAPPGWTIYIQGACDLAPYEKVLADWRHELDVDLAKRKEEASEGLRTAAIRLLGISLLTFAATLAGGLWLVWLGLRPLHRLGEAVSLVSERDFRLPLDPARLPEELRPIAERLRQTLDQLKDAFGREKQAAADISHELRTPVAALLATLDVALRKPRSADEYRRVLEECRSNCEHMGELVEKMLALARLDAGATTIRTRLVDAVDVAEQSAALVRPLAEARGLQLLACLEGPAPVVTDPDKLREVLTNLLHNAVEYNRPQGRIDLALGRVDGHVRFSVRDTGIGIPEEARQHIFKRFYRADPSRQADGAHAGIGLAIVKGYVDLLGGTIAVDSAVGEGTTFTIQLPAA